MPQPPSAPARKPYFKREKKAKNGAGPLSNQAQLLAVPKTSLLPVLPDVQLTRTDKAWKPFRLQDVNKDKETLKTDVSSVDAT